MKRAITISFLIIVIVICGSLGGFYHYLNQPYGKNAIEIHIPKGTPSNLIIEALADYDVIPHPLLFKIYLTLTRKLNKIRAGDYIFPAQVSPIQVAKLLQKGDFKTFPITLIEGWTLQQVTQYLAEKGFANSETFLALCYDPRFIKELGIHATSLEGYLYPDTYEIYSPKNERELIEKFVKHFWEVYSPEWRERTQQMGWTINQVVTLASIVEKETGAASERPLIASVFLNRLRKKMPLEADPTVIYGIPDFNGNLTRRDLETPTPYNTYTNPGLPLGPIANPGYGSLKAVFFPAETNYLFFVSRNDGTHYFSSNMRDHGNAVRKYQKNRRKKSQ